jgi:integrase
MAKTDYKPQLSSSQLATLEKATEALDSAHTKRAYKRFWTAFYLWLGDREINLEITRAYRAYLVNQKISAQNLNQNIYAVRSLVRYLADEGLLAAETAELACKIKTQKVRGRKVGNWLSIEEAERIINKPGTDTPMGIRDRAILGLLIGAGLRRGEAATIKLQEIERREGRWVIAGLLGKHGRTRNIPIADWVKGLIDTWAERAAIKSGYLFRAVSWNEKKQRLLLRETPLTANALFYIVQRYGWQIDRPQIAPHDLRRTFARLAYDGNAPMAQIQLALGHSNQVTTERYINAMQDFQVSPSDLLGINVES